MDCPSPSITCSIDRLGSTLTSWDWNAFLSTTIATLVGALVAGAIAGLVAWLVYHRESNERRRSRLDDQLRIVISELASYSLSLRAVWEKAQLTAPDSMTVDPLYRPQDWAVLAAIANARFSAEESERVLLDRIRDVVIEARGLDIPVCVGVITEVWPVLIVWRDGVAKDAALARLETKLASAPDQSEKD